LFNSSKTTKKRNKKSHIQHNKNKEKLKKRQNEISYNTESSLGKKNFRDCFYSKYMAQLKSPFIGLMAALFYARLREITKQ
jgi:hypothetical protein